MAIFTKVLNIFDKKDKIKILLLAILCLLGAFAETLSIGVILPFMSIINDPDKIKEYNIFVDFFKSLSKTEIILLVCILLLVTFILKNVYLYFLNYMQAKFIYGKQIQLAKRLLKSYFKKPYSFFFERNTAELQRNINYSLPNMITNVLLFSVYLLTEVLVIILIFILLFLTDKISTLIIFVILSMTILIIYLRFKKTTIFYGKKQQATLSEMIKWINQSINGIKEIKIKENHEYYIKQYESYGFGYAKSTTFNAILSQIPRFAIEIVAVFCFVIILGVNILLKIEISDIISKLTLFAMGAFRLMPSFNRVVTYVNSIRFNSSSLGNIYDDLVESRDMRYEEDKNVSGLEFHDKIEISNLCFKYKSVESFLLNKINIVIKKGSKIGIIGPSGEGKTTFLDLILGLHKPDEGNITVDGINIFDNLGGWHKLIGYIPQIIYLIDDSIFNNITIGIVNANVARVWEVLDIVRLKEFVEGLPNLLETKIGENGIMLSGGQRQRIAIARAMYGNPEILVMDEATSALDNDTEAYITDTIDSIRTDKTFIIVAHRLSTLKSCDFIYKIENGKAVLQEGYVQ